jgi:peptidoglycan/xylan/chitin deacetylase (PgdA/CDA1 family)
MKSRLAAAVRTRIGRAQRARRRKREPHGLILCYHRVADVRTDPWQLCVKPQHFAEQLAVLHDVADIVPLRHLQSRLESGTSSRPGVAITFDDGYADNLHAALPLLERFEAPATVFVCTGTIGRRQFWWDRLATIVLEADPLPPHLDIDKIGLRRTGLTPRDRDSLHVTLWRALRQLDEDHREGILEWLAEWAGKSSGDGNEARPMTTDELRTFAASPLIEIGAHSVTHRSFSALPEQVQLAEIEQSGRACERMTGLRPESFAYPFGDMAPATAEMVRQAGFARACSQRPDLVWCDSDPYRLPRIGAFDQGTDSFIRKLRRQWLS